MLEAVGFIERALAPSGSRYKAAEGGLHRKPILFVFGPEYVPAFLAVNKRAQAARSGHRRERRSIAPTSSSRPSVGILEARRTNSPKSKSEAKPQVIMGEITKEIGLPAQPSAPTALDLALQQLSRAIGLADGGSQDHGGKS